MIFFFWKENENFYDKDKFEVITKISQTNVYGFNYYARTKNNFSPFLSNYSNNHL